MQRNPLNRNQTIYTQPYYQGLPVLPQPGGMIESYLGSLQRVIGTTLDDYPRVFAFRLDLRFPAYCQEASVLLQETGNVAITKFLASFKAKMKHCRAVARQSNPYAHDSVVRYVWTREVGAEGMLHYHLAILLNRDAFAALGAFELGRRNIYNRLTEAWASALGITVEAAAGLVNIPDNAVYHLNRDDQLGQGEFFRRASYLCKASTKSTGKSHHGFGASRN
ncbi:inovirus Gp2 family protein [Vogesella indigofera]|uniref:inovirus Gp2 family protein n=1 Tax=Vogesella indigofera TaxID=45465 RepID=UPI00234E6B10|nr:inovirus Gp2 family protein [Vogesella indigofera]MDC7698339.1 inovirus Gp2 family protein [Vogesella indigofera]